MYKIITLAILLTTQNIGNAAYGDENYPFTVIVNSQNSVSSVDRQFLADVYFKKVKRWQDDGTIYPVDLSTDTSTRRDFTDVIFRRPVVAIKSFWQQAIFSGRDVPPPELANDRDVIQYVQKYRGSVGYVSNGALSGSGPPTGVKIIKLKAR